MPESQPEHPDDGAEAVTASPIPDAADGHVTSGAEAGPPRLAVVPGPVVAVIDGGPAPGARDGGTGEAGERNRGDSIVEIYQAEHVALFRFIRAATGDDEVAEDVLQETFLRLVREVAAGRVPMNVHAWLFKVASNVIVSQVRRARTAERHLSDLALDRLAASPEQYVLEAERDDEVRVALETLPVDSRLAILLAAQGFTGHEIAMTLGRTDGAVRTLLCRARLRVRARLEPRATFEAGAVG